jgi:hypothetical protein
MLRRHPGFVQINLCGGGRVESGGSRGGNSKKFENRDGRFFHSGLIAINPAIETEKHC